MEGKSCLLSGRGLARSGGESFPRDHLLPRRPAQLLLTKGWGDDLALIDLISWTFLVWAPSECLPLVRRKLGEDLPSDSRLERKEVIGLTERKLVINLKKSGHVPGGSWMTRVCACEAYASDFLGLHVSRLLRPVCRIWPAIAREAAAGEPLSPGWAARKVLKELRSFAQLKNWQRGARMGTHPFRRGAGRDILGAGGSFPQFLRSGRILEIARGPLQSVSRSSSGASRQRLTDKPKLKD